MRSRIRLILVFTIISIVLLPVICPAGSGCPDDRAAFDAGYKNYRKACRAWCRITFESAWRYPGKELIDLGPTAVPFLIEKMAKRQDMELFPRQFKACCAITRKRFQPCEVMAAARAGTLPDLFVHWWNVERRNNPQAFAALYDDWKAAMKEGNLSATHDALEGMRNMGVDALPFIMEKIRGGDDELVPLVGRIMGKPVGGDRPTAASVLEWWIANEKIIRLPDPV